MKARRWIVWGAVLVVAAVFGALLLKRSGAAGSSTLALSPGGWLAARTYCERRGSAVSLADRPLDEKGGKPEGALVLTFPWEMVPMPSELDALRRYVSMGATVVFAYSEQPHAGEAFVADALGLEFESVRGEPPLDPRRWYAYASAEWRLKPEELFGAGAGDVVIHAPEEIPKAPKGAGVFYRGDANAPVIFAHALGRGRILVLPADALSNARLGNPGNANLLESLRVFLGERIVFDEYHHGLVAPGAVAESSSASSLDLLLAELVLLYLLSAWTLGRRFGPAWEEPPELASSTSSFLLGLAAMHRKLRHSAEAAVHLIGNAEGFDPGVSIPAKWRQAAVEAGDAELVDLAKFVARQQRRRKVD